MPGPICFGRGGTRPTLADANALLGRLDAASLAGASGAGDLASVREAFARALGEPLGLDPIDAAAAVVRVADARMAGAVRMVSVSLGADPRDFSLFAFGGAGPLHAASIARELGVPTVLVPPRPGITNALGCLVAELRHDFVDTFDRALDALDPSELHARLRARVAEGERLVRSHGAALVGVRHALAVDMRFVGQTHLLRVPLASLTPSIETLRQAFEAAYLARFRVELDDIRAAVVNVVVSVVGERAEVDPGTLIDARGRAGSLDGARVGERDVHVGGAFHRTPVYRRERLPLDARVDGPAVVEQMDATTLVPPGDSLVGDVHGNLLLHVGGAS